MIAMLMLLTLAGPGVPSSVRAVADSPSKATVSWNYQSQGAPADGFYVERSLKPSSGFVRVATVTASSRVYHDSGLYADTGYYYRLRAYKNSQASNYSLIVMAVTNPLQAPIVNAGIDQDLLLGNTSSLMAVVTTDGLRPTDIVSYKWYMVSGPGLVDFSNATGLITTAKFTVVGRYVLRFEATIVTANGVMLRSVARVQMA